MILTPPPAAPSDADRMALELVEIVTAYLATRGVGLSKPSPNKGAERVRRQLERAEEAIDDLEICLIRIRSAAKELSQDS